MDPHYGKLLDRSAKSVESRFTEVRDFFYSQFKEHFDQLDQELKKVYVDSNLATVEREIEKLNSLDNKKKTPKEKVSLEVKKKALFEMRDMHQVKYAADCQKVRERFNSGRLQVWN